MDSKNLKIDGQRLWADIMSTATIGGTPKGGICRLTLSDLDRQVRDWFRARCEEIGCAVSVDRVGNMFALLPGSDPDLPPIAIGSHLDTQPTGGKFDGVLGVLSGLEVLRTFRDAGLQTRSPLVLCNWTNEEGSRFAPAMMGSGVFAGVFSEEYVNGTVDRGGVTFAEAIDSIGYRGAEPLGAYRFAGYFELHIEQGPVLEAEAKTIGIVTGIQGQRWYEVSITGREAHAGTTPMPLRRDALAGAARLIQAVEAIAKRHPPASVGTVGLIEARPNSRNVVPGEVFLTVDLRNPASQTLDELEADLYAAAAELGESGLDVACRRIWEQPPISFDPTCIDCVRQAARSAGLPTREIISGAGHDAGYLSRVAPTTMIFAPCKDGLSHNEEESATFEDCAAAVQVLMEAVLRYDEIVSQRA